MVWRQLFFFFYSLIFVPSIATLHINPSSLFPERFGPYSFNCNFFYLNEFKLRCFFFILDLVLIILIIIYFILDGFLDWVFFYNFILYYIYISNFVPFLLIFIF